MFDWLLRRFRAIPPPDPVGYRRDYRRAQQEAHRTLTVREAYNEPSGAPNVKGLVGGRATTDDLLASSPYVPVVLPPPDSDGSWSVSDLDVNALDKRPPGQLLELLADLSPDVSNALWQWLRLCNPGWTVKALKAGADLRADAQPIDPVAQAALDSFLGRLHDLYGTVDVVISRIFATAFLRGSLFAELVIAPDGRTPIDLATPDPFTVRFRREDDKERGPVWQLCQLQYSGGIVPLTRPTIRYIPIDPMPGRPYGRPMASPVLHTALFLIGLLHDLRRVISQQGYPRHDLSIDLVRLKEAMPPEDVNDVDKFLDWAQAVYAETRKAYEALEPDDAFIHTDVVTVNRPVGTLSAEALGAVSGILSALERMATRALKTQPILIGSADPVSDAAANRQWEIYSQGTKTIQHYVEVLLERLCTMALQAQGIAATVQWRFAVVRGAERFMDAQVQRMLIDNARVAYDNGLVSMDQQAMMALGAQKADQKKPRVEEVKGQASMPKAAVPDSGSLKAAGESNGHTREEGNPLLWPEPALP